MDYLHIFAYICPKWPKCRERFQQNGAYRYYNGCSSPRSSTTGGGGFRSLSGAWSVLLGNSFGKRFARQNEDFSLANMFPTTMEIFMGMWWLVLRILILTGWAAVIWPDDAEMGYYTCPFELPFRYGRKITTSHMDFGVPYYWNP